MLSEAKHLVPQLVQRDSSLAPLAQNDKFTLVGLRRSFASHGSNYDRPVSQVSCKQVGELVGLTSQLRGE